jgi:hypothetical protein
MGTIRLIQFHGSEGQMALRASDRVDISHRVRQSTERKPK